MLQIIEAPVTVVPSCATTPKKLLTSAELQAYDPESEPWQKQFSRRYTHHTELMGVLHKVEDVNHTVYDKFATTPALKALVQDIVNTVAITAIQAQKGPVA